jgi:hypothetical protein
MNICDGKYLLMKSPDKTYVDPVRYGDLLFDIEKDPMQENPLNDKAIMKKMCKKLREEMEKIEAPKEEFIRIGLV